MHWGVGSQTISKCWTRCFKTAINEGWIWGGTEQWARYYRTGERSLFNHGDWIIAWENKMLPCMFWPLGLEVIAEVRTQNNSSLNPGHILLFVVGECRDFFISRINRKGPNPLSMRFRGKQDSWARVPVPRCRAAHKKPQRMWLAGHTPWVMTALPKNAGPQQRMSWKPVRSLPGKPQPAIYHLQCVWVGSFFSLSALASLNSHQIPGLLTGGAGPVQFACWWCGGQSTCLNVSKDSPREPAFRSPCKAAAPEGLKVGLHRWSTQREVLWGGSSMPIPTTAVLAFYCCYDKLPQTSSSKATPTCYLSVLEVSNLKWTHRTAFLLEVPGETLFPCLYNF